ncbi:MAG: DMT family transporter [Gammaproteobacteria bacterium]|nr:DMT family transporter [Gammaproteobacteria bacterium]
MRYRNNNLLGIGLMVMATLLFATMDAVAKSLVTADLHAAQVIAVRSWIILPLILLTLALRGELAALKTARPGRHLLRGMVGCIAPLCFFSALKTLPLADATVVFFSSAFMLTAASALILRERVGIHRWSAVVLGFAGVVIAMNPTGGGDIVGYLLVLIATLIYALIFITGKQLSRQDSVILLVFSLHLGMGVVATALLPWVWQPMSPAMLVETVLLATLALAAHYAFAAAFARGDVSVLAPFEYTTLLWAVALGYLLWGDLPGVEAWLGAAIIIACGIYVAHREALHRPRG